MNIKDINKLLKLYRQLLKSISSETSKKKELWEQCLEQAKKEYIDELKEHESQLSAPRTPPRKASKEDEKEFQKVFQHNTSKNAEKIYRQEDTKYNKALLKIEQKRKKLIKDIDHFQYSIRDQLIEFDRAYGTLLSADMQKIREIFPVIDITQPNFQFYIEKSIDALEAIKAKIEYQQQVEPIQKPAETEQKAANKCWRIWFWIKRIPRWIYVLIIFLAALLTIFYYLGWLEPIKTFIYKVVSTR